MQGLRSSAGLDAPCMIDILVVKYRKQVFTDEISERAKAIFESIVPKYKIELVEWHYDKDHVYILCKGQPKTGSSVGIDLGVTDFASLSTGEKIGNERFLKQLSKN